MGIIQALGNFTNQIQVGVRAVAILYFAPPSIRDFLSVVAASKGNPQLVNSFLQSHLQEIDDNFAPLLKSWARATLLETKSESAEAIRIVAQIIFTFSNSIYAFTSGNLANNLEIAIAGYEIAASVFTREAFPYEWAKAQNNLGNTYSDRIKGDKAENIETAIRHYTNSLAAYNRNKFPVDWAKAQNNLANAYADRIEGDKAENIEMAISCYQTALEILTHKKFPSEWAWTQNNLGNTYSDRIKGDKAENIETAIACYKLALQVYTREGFPSEWAWTKCNLGHTYQDRIRGDKAENLEIAIDCHHAALQVYTHEAFPVDWARTQNYLGNAYSNRIRGNRAENLETAIASYQAALQVYTHQRFPTYWAITHNDLGNAYSNRIKGNRAENLETAIASYQNALQVYTHETFPVDWARSQSYLGDVYSERIKEDKAENLEVAINYYQAALQVVTYETLPYEWATIQNNLGKVYTNRIKGERAENIEAGIHYFQATLQVYSNQTFPNEWARTHVNLGNAYGERIKGDNAENLEIAINCLRKALQVYQNEASLDLARTQNNLGNCYLFRIRGDREKNIEAAIHCCQAALQFITCETFPYEWAMTHCNLGNCYNSRSKGDRDNNLETAIRCCQAALQVFTHTTYPYEWAKAQSILGGIFIDRVKGDRTENLETALLCYQSVLKVYTREGFPYNWASTKNSIGVIYFYKSFYNSKEQRVKNLELAIQEYSLALEVRNREAFAQDYVKTAFDLGLAYQGAKKFRLAYDIFKCAIETVDLLRGEIISGEESKQKLAEQWNPLYRSMIDVCLELKKDIQAIEYVEFSKTRNLVELILERDMKTIFPPDVVTQLEKYRDEIAKGRDQIQKGKAENQTALAQYMTQLRQQRNELQSRYLPVAQDYKFNYFQKNLDKHTAIVEFYITDNKLLTFLFTRQTQQPIVWQSQPKGLDKLRNWVKGYLRAYDNHKTWQLHGLKPSKEFHWQRRLNTRLHLLAQILDIDKIIKRIPKECDRLIFIPHRYLHLFPLHALPINSQQGEGTSEILMHRFPAGVSYVPSCQLLQLAQTRKRPNFTHLFAVQNPTSDLSYTNIEVETIKGYFNPADVLVETTATKAAIDSKPLNTFHCTHFSCHGYFNYENPLKSALILANSHKPTPAEINPECYLPLGDNEVLDLDQCLTLDAAFALKLEQCRLVTLSACETGLIDFKNISDEYIGLPSGFLVAGSPAVVSSLWTVDDLSTALLMIKFYENLRKPMSLALALNQAQLWLRDATKEELLNWTRLNNNFKKKFHQQVEEELEIYNPDEKPFYSPFHWAAFCAVGQ